MLLRKVVLNAKFFSVTDQWDMVEGEACPYYLMCCSTFSLITVTCSKPTACKSTIIITTWSTLNYSI